MLGLHYKVVVSTFNGNAYIFTRDGTTWTEQRKVATSGYADVALDADTVVIGMPWDDEYRGSVSIYTRSGTTWIEEQKLTAGAGSAVDDGFGAAVAISGDTVVVGHAGGVYIFTRSGTAWSEALKWTASDDMERGIVGWDAAIDGDTIVINRAFSDDGSNIGSVYVFTRSGTTWTEEKKLTTSNGVEGDWFTFSVAIAGDALVVGAINENDSGSVHVFIRSGRPPLMVPRKTCLVTAWPFTVTLL